MLRVEHLQKKFSFTVPRFTLKDIQFHLPKGYIMGLVGSNGCGKSTLIRTILGLYQMDAGKVYFDGKKMEVAEEEIKESLGVVLDQGLFEKRWSAKKNASVYGPLFRKYNEETFERYLKEFGVNPDIALKKLSKGNEIRFQLAFALSHDAKLFVFDEPAAGLDKEFRKELLEIMRNLVIDGKRSVLVATHIMEDLEQSADYITYMDKGQVLLSDDIEHIKDSFILVQAEEYKINLLPQQYVLYRKKGTYGTTALVAKDAEYALDGAYQKHRPTIEDLMYYYTKSERVDKMAWMRNYCGHHVQERGV